MTVIRTDERKRQVLTAAEEKTAGELDAKQQKVLTALLSHNTIPEAAKACRMSEATLYRFMRVDDFKFHYRHARAEIVEHAITQLQHNCATASDTLRAVCEDKDAPASARISAAKAILDGAVKGVELQDLTARIEEIERSLPKDEKGNK